MPYPDTLTHVDHLVTLSPDRMAFAEDIGRALWMSEGPETPESFDEIMQPGVRQIYIAKGYDLLLAMEALGLEIF